MAQLTDNAIKLLKEKQYFRENENKWEDLCHRVATGIASAEEDQYKRQEVYDQVYISMTNLEFLFSTPVLLNADETHQGQLSSCFVLDVKDTIESICQLDAQFTKIFQRNGGAGANLSALRPAKSKVETSNGYAGGVVSFMHKYDMTADKMTENNPSRKGALKINLSVFHPQIYDFISCKDDVNQLQRMNISVSLSDEFMKAVEEDQDWNLRFPDYSWNKEIYDNEWNGEIEDWESKGYPVVIHKTIKARKLFHDICEHAWKTGEPGLNFSCTMKKDNKNPHINTKVETNPCLHKDTYMVTENGLEKISKLKSQIWNGVDFVPTKTWKTGIKKVYKIMTKSGFEYITTDDHRFLLKNGEWCNAIDLIGKDISFEIKEKEWKGINPHPNANYEILGFEFGDATFHKASDRMKYIYANPEKDMEIINIIESEFKDKFAPRDIKKPDINHVINIPYGTVYANAFYDKIENRMIPDWIMSLPKGEMRSFLRGLFSANGTNLKERHRIQLVSVNAEMLKQVQQMLLMFGIKGKLWYHNKQNDIEFENGTYTCKQSAHIVISRDSYKRYLDNIGFIQSYKNGYLEYGNQIDTNFETVILISELDDAEVWDFTENTLHMGITNGAYVHNCSEFSNIPYSSCNLGSHNISLFVKEDGTFDFKRFKDTIYKSVRWFDNMITINKLPLSDIEEMTKGIRPIGMGFMGLAHAMYKMGIKYNSEEGYKFTSNILKIMRDTSEKASIELAKERGTYPKWEGSNWEKEGKKIRNSSLLSIAPTGSISFIANTSGGCEPEFALVYTRRTYDGNIYYIVNELFKNKLIELGIYSDELLQKIVDNHGSCQGIKEIPKEVQNVFVTAHDITPSEHLHMLSVVQEYVDLSVSKTVNLSNSATIEDIEKIYKDAWKLKVKGLTVYRDGSRENQTLSVTRKDEESKSSEIVKFDSIYPLEKEDLGETYGTNVKEKVACGNLYLNLCRDENGYLSEIFINTSKGGICQSNINALSRLISMALRGGIKVEAICDQLMGIKCPACTILRSQGKDVNASCPDAIGQYILEKYNQGNTMIVEKFQRKKKPTKNEKMKCPNCGEQMRLESGCVICKCGFSKCG